MHCVLVVRQVAEMIGQSHPRSQNEDEFSRYTHSTRY
jgi:hypothetical protein